MSEPFKDDGRRDELRMFMKHRDEHTSDIVSGLRANTQFWAARIFLELLWEYESHLVENPQETKAP